jgi:hypothetical protein
MELELLEAEGYAESFPENKKKISSSFDRISSPEILVSRRQHPKKPRGLGYYG